MIPTTVMLILLCAFLKLSAGKSLKPWVYEIFPVGKLKPQGWFQKELEIQADGLSGHLSLFWPDIANSTWIGGPDDGGLHERAPYWLNGMTPLSFLLPENSELTRQTLKYISYILNNQQSNGWLGPSESNDLNSIGGNTYWSRFNILNSLRMYCEGLESIKGNNSLNETNLIKTAMLKYIIIANNLMNTTQSMSDWSSARYMDYILSIHWLIENGNNIITNYIDFLYNAAELAHSQGFNWEYWFNNLPKKAVPAANCTLYTHGVNNAQALKSAAVWYRQTHNETLRTFSFTRMENMDKYHGQATGMFGADEHLAGRMPSRGTELCTVVESMYSYQIMFRVFGNVKYLDKLERIATNALPATFASPKGGDMWAHQYLQQNNEINAIYSNPHVWATDGPNSTTYGLAPNYGCCTANFNQGWPKYSFSIFYIKNNTDAAIGIYLPSYIEYPNNIGNGAKINITTNYPFEDNIYINIENTNKFNLWLRIPTWTTNSTIILNDKNIFTYNDTNNIKGTMQKILIPSINQNENNNNNKLFINFHPKFRLYSGFNGSVALLRGSILFSLTIGELFKVVAVHPYQSRDYEISPETTWNYALMVSDFNDLEKDFIFENNGYVVGHAPFNRSDIPVQVWANAVNTTRWNIENNAAQSPPTSPVCTNSSVVLDENDMGRFGFKTDSTFCGTATQIKLVPHGCTDLRIAEFPLAYTNYSTNG